MSSRTLARAEWRRYFDQVSKGLTDKHAELELLSFELGNQIEARWLPLKGIVYDPKSDVFEVALEGLDHLISHPREVYVEETARGVVTLEITSDDETRQIVRFREPLVVPVTESV